MEILEKPWKISDKIDISNLYKTKKKKLFGVRTKWSYYTIFLWKFISHRNEKKKDTDTDE